MIAERQRIMDIPALPNPVRGGARPAAVAPGWERHLPTPPAPEAIRRPMAHRGPLPLRRARALPGDGRTPAAVLIATFVVGFLCIYISAYARVTAEGFELSRLKTDVRKAQLQHEMLQAEVSQLTLPETVRERAAALGMVENTPQAAVVVTAAPEPAASSAVSGTLQQAAAR